MIISATLMAACLDKFMLYEHRALVNYRHGKLKVNYAIIFVILSATFPIIVEMLRYGVGTDQLSYSLYRIPRILNGTETNIPQGYQILIRILSYINKDGLIIYGLALALEIILFYMYFLEASTIQWMSVLTFFLLGIYNTSLNISRQMLSVSIFFFATRFIKRKQPIKYVICILIAISIHTVSVIYLPMYLLPKLNLRKNMKPVLCLACIGIFNRPFLELLEWLSRQIPALGTYYLYFSGQYFADSFSWSIAFVTIAPLICYLIFDKAVLEGSKLEERNLYFNIAWICCIPAILNVVIPNADRFIFMLLPANCIYMPNLTIRLTSKAKVQFTISMILIYLCFYMYYIVFLNCGQTFPYKTWVTLP